MFAYSSGVQNSLFHLHTQKDSKVTDVCLRCGDERIYRQSFFCEFAFLLEHRSMPGEQNYTLMDARIHGEHNEPRFKSVRHYVSKL